MEDWVSPATYALIEEGLDSGPPVSGSRDGHPEEEWTIWFRSVRYSQNVPRLIRPGPTRPMSPRHLTAGSTRTVSHVCRALSCVVTDESRLASGAQDHDVGTDVARWHPEEGRNPATLHMFRLDCEPGGFTQ